MAEACLLSKQQQQQQILLRRQLHPLDDYESYDVEPSERGEGALLSWLQPLATRPPPLPPVSVPHLTFPLATSSGNAVEPETTNVEPVVRAFRTLFSAPPPRCTVRLEPIRPPQPAAAADGSQAQAVVSDAGDSAQPLKYANQKLRVVRAKFIFGARIQRDNNGRQVLIVDTAEPAEVRSELAKVNATMASAKLVSGDFAWMAVPVETPTSEYVSRGMMLNTGVERKRVADLVASIRDQRLKTQMCCCPPVSMCFSRRFNTMACTSWSACRGCIVWSLWKGLLTKATTWRCPRTRAAAGRKRGPTDVFAP